MRLAAERSQRRHGPAANDEISEANLQRLARRGSRNPLGASRCCMPIHISSSHVLKPIFSEGPHPFTYTRRATTGHANWPKDLKHSYAGQRDQ
jgi:hypothetical protein